MAAKQIIQGISHNFFSVDPDLLTIVEDKKHYLYDERIELPVLDALVQSILANGYDSSKPITLVKEGDKFLVADGRQRLRAVREANRLNQQKNPDAAKFLVDVVFRKGSEADVYALMNRANAEGLMQFDDAVTRAIKCQKMIDLGIQIEKIAVDYGVQPVVVKRWLKLLELAPKHRAMVKAGKLTVDQGVALVGLPEEKVEAAIEAAKDATGRVRPDKAKAAIKKAKTGKEVSPRPARKTIKALYKSASKIPKAKETSYMKGMLDALCWILEGESSEAFSALVADMGKPKAVPDAKADEAANDQDATA